MTSHDWFENLTGFRESSYQATKANFELLDRRLRSKGNGREFDIGHFETPSLAELRVRGHDAANELASPIAVENQVGDVRRLHADPASDLSLFQVASQFNCLEMIGPDVTPERGVTRYATDHTQGPACAVAAGAATIYRNYFAKVGVQEGQTRDRQLDCLADLGSALGNVGGALWEMRNGYALCTQAGLEQINQQLAACTDSELNTLRDLLRIGLHWDVEVTDAKTPGIHVTQAFCSALPVAYSQVNFALWKPLASLVLEAAYEATLWAGVLNYKNSGNRTVNLTMLGGGAFGNEPDWIIDALRRALMLFSQVALDVRIISYSATPPVLRALAAEFA